MILVWGWEISLQMVIVEVDKFWWPLLLRDASTFNTVGSQRYKLKQAVASLTANGYTLQHMLMQKLLLI